MPLPLYTRPLRYWLLLMLLTACGQPRPDAEVGAPATSQVIPAVEADKAAATPVIMDPTASINLSAKQLYESFAATADTSLRWQNQRYYLRWQVRLDTLQQLTHITPPDKAIDFAGDTTNGFQGYYHLEVRDSLGQRVGQHTFTKTDFYRIISPELAISSGVELPRLLGYSQPLGGLLFGIYFAAPGTDWYGEAVLLLDLSGKVQYLTAGSGGDPEVATTLSSDGRTLLTATNIWHAGQPPRPLGRPRAELRGARLLNDTLLLTVDEPGQTRQTRNGPELVVTPTQRRRPNALVRDVRTGRTVSSFRYDGFYAELGYIVPWHVVPQARAAYLLDANKGLYVLPLRSPAAYRLLPFATLSRASGLPQADEVAFELSSQSCKYRFLIDTTQATRVRYEKLMQ